MIKSEIQTIVDEEIKNKTIPALAVSIIESGKIFHLNTNGYLDLQNKIFCYDEWYLDLLITQRIISLRIKDKRTSFKSSVLKNTFNRSY